MTYLKQILITILFGGLLALSLWTSVQAHPDGATRYVAPGGNCGGATPCYATIQAAVDVAAEGDLIKIAQGTYTDIHARNGLTQVVYIAKSVTLQGGYAPNNWGISNPIAHPTVINAQDKGRGIYAKDKNIVIQNLRITRGNARGQGGTSWGSDVGGGIFATGTSLHLRGCELDHNQADNGSGVYITGGQGIQVEQCHIHHNQGKGAALAVSNFQQAEIADNLIERNNGGNDTWGCGIGASNGSHLTLHDNKILYNKTTFYGGGASIDWVDDLLLENNLIMQNEGSQGGGLFLYHTSRVRLLRNRIIDNSAWKGGGIFIEGGALVFQNNVITDNRSPNGGVAINLSRADLQLIHTTVARNQGKAGIAVQTFRYGDVNAPSHVTMTNTILFSHTVGISIDKDSTVQSDSVLWQQNGKDWDGVGIITHTHDHRGDPKFAFDGYHLLAGSAAIDQGVNAGVTRDIDRDPRPYGPGYDLGADEFNGAVLQAKKLYLPLALRRK